MIRSLSPAMNGFYAQQPQLDVILTRLANAAASEFGRLRAVFEGLFLQVAPQAGAPPWQRRQGPLVGLHAGAHLATTGRIQAPDNRQRTGSSRDLAIRSQGFLEIQMPDGTTAFLRDAWL